MTLFFYCPVVPPISKSISRVAVLRGSMSKPRVTPFQVREVRVFVKSLTSMFAYVFFMRFNDLYTAMSR